MAISTILLLFNKTGINHLGTRSMTFGGSFYALLLAAFVGIALLAGLDLLADWGTGIGWVHILAEGAVIAIALTGIGVLVHQLIRQVRTARLEATTLAHRLATVDQEAAKWRQEAQGLLRGLAAAMDRQFEAWHLTKAEKEVALLLLKGLSHKEIAQARQVSEATARQQARAVYRKAGLAGRRDLAAFFLEELTLPAAER